MIRRVFSVWVVGMGFLVGAGQVRAGYITYTPSGSFTAGTDASVTDGGSTVTVTNGGTVTVSFTPASMTSVDPGSTPTLGTFSVSASSTATTVPTSPMPTTFLLSIAQTTPTSGSQSFNSATLSGTVSSGGGVLDLTFSNTAITIGPVTYQLENLTSGTLFLANTGSTTLTGLVTAVPEPGTWTMSLTAAGLLGLAGWCRVYNDKRRRLNRTT